MIVAFEGMDGVGKSSTAKRTAELLNYKYIEKTLQDIMKIDELSYLKLVKEIRTCGNKYASAVFFTLKMILDNNSKENRIIDRSILSLNYFEKNNISEEDFQNIIKMGTIPDLTIILYASTQTRLKRIYNRNQKDFDLHNQEVLCDGYEEMINFAKKNNIPYIGINTEDLSKEEVIRLSSLIISEYEKIPDDKKVEYINELNEIYGFDHLYKQKIRGL